jgi:hypothetical protein
MPRSPPRRVSLGAIGIRVCQRQYRFAHQRVLEHCCFQAAPVIGDDGAATGFGTLGRNTYRGPFEQDCDLSIIKTFSLTERQKIRLTVDLVDVWNHPVFSSPTFTGVRNRLRLGNLARRKIIGESFSFRLNGHF